MLKLSFSKPTYHYYMNDTVVICTYNCTIIDSESKYPETEFAVSAKAVCNTDDVPNKDKGTMIADSRAKAKAYAYARNYYDKEDTYKGVIRMYSDKLRFYTKLKYLKRQEDSHLNWILHNDFPLNEDND